MLEVLDWPVILFIVGQIVTIAVVKNDTKNLREDMKSLDAKLWGIILNKTDIGKELK